MASVARYFAKNLIFQCRKAYFCKSSSRCFSQSPIVYNSIKFSERHEWITVEGNVGTVGVSQFAQMSLGDVVYVELPEIGKQLVKDDEVGVIESVKAANEYYSPVGGTVTEVNKQLEEKPSIINDSCYDKGWIYKLELLDPKEIDDLMEEDAYQKYLKEIHS